MKKSEYIARYGEERYNEYKASRVTEYAEEKSIIVDDITVKLSLPLPDYEDYLEQLAEIDRMIGRLQHIMRMDWGKETRQRFILVVDGGVISNKKKVFSVKVNLAQLGMNKVTRDKFKEFVNGREWSSLI